MGVKPRTEETIMTVADGRVFKCSMSEPVSRIVPTRLVSTVETSKSSSIAVAALSICIMPALLIRTFNAGWFAMQVLGSFCHALATGDVDLQGLHSGI